VHECRQRVLEREAVADKQHAQAWAVAARKRDVTPQGRSKERAREADVNEPDVGREPEHDPRDGAREESQQPAHLLCIGSGQGLLDLPRYPKGLRRNIRG
jgi:hypothetical protein